MNINVTYTPEAHYVKLWWYSPIKNGIRGIAEWEALEIECEHDNVEFDVENDGQEVFINDVSCPDCTLNDEQKKSLIDGFDYDQFWSNKHDIDVDYYREMEAGIE